MTMGSPSMYFMPTQSHSKKQKYFVYKEWPRLTDTFLQSVSAFQNMIDELITSTTGLLQFFKGNGYIYKQKTLDSTKKTNFYPVSKKKVFRLSQLFAFEKAVSVIFEAESETSLKQQPIFLPLFPDILYIVAGQVAGANNSGNLDIFARKVRGPIYNRSRYRGVINRSGF